MLEIPGGAECVSYDPGLIPGGTRERSKRGPSPAPPAPLHGRFHFESLFASTADPWRYTSPYEETKYEQTLALLPAGRIGRVLELACAEGHFTYGFSCRSGRCGLDEPLLDLPRIEVSGTDGFDAFVRSLGHD